MNDNEARNESVADGVFDEIAAQNHETFTQQGRPDRAAADPAKTGATGPQSDHTKKQTEKQEAKNEADEDGIEGDNAAGLDTQDFSREPKPPVDATDDEATTAPSQKETTAADADIDWRSDLPTDPGEFKVEAPKPDEFGQIDPLEYTDYLEARLDHKQRIKAYNTAVITKVFETAEQILPEVKENKALQAAIKNTFATSLSGDEVVEFAKSMRAQFDKIAGENKAAGIQNAKTSITIQKNATVESKNSTQKKVQTSKNDNLERRLKANDTSAFEELMGGWLAEGKI